MSSTEGLFTFAGYSDLGQIFTSRLSASISAYGQNPSNKIADWAHLADVLTLSGSDPSQWSIRLEERHTSDDPAGSPTWSDWVEFQVGAVTARAFQFRVWLFSLGGGVTPVITDLSITIDMPDRIIAQKDLTSGTAAGGFRVDFTPNLRALKAVTISVTLATGDWYEFVAKDETGFTIRFKNSAGTVVSKVFDHASVGYGSKG